nr:MULTISPECIES: hypothetical protein [unclassified Gilliamella]
MNHQILGNLISWSVGRQKMMMGQTQLLQEVLATKAGVNPELVYQAIRGGISWMYCIRC